MLSYNVRTRLFEPTRDVDCEMCDHCAPVSESTLVCPDGENCRHLSLIGCLIAADPILPLVPFRELDGVDYDYTREKVEANDGQDRKPS